MTILRPQSRTILDAVSGLLSLMWDKFFNDVQKALNNIQGNASFTMTATTSKTIADTRVTASSHITLMATNAPAADLMAGSAALYVSARTPGVSFTVTAAAGSAAGTETFTYGVLG
jgi:hypothetical protein